jgi:hypothetical protein
LRPCRWTSSTSRRRPRRTAICTGGSRRNDLATLEVEECRTRRTSRTKGLCFVWRRRGTVRNYEPKQRGET